jgi:hypothetical protein
VWYCFMCVCGGGTSSCLLSLFFTLFFLFLVSMRYVRYLLVGLWIAFMIFFVSDLGCVDFGGVLCFYYV